jgi:hypothetical protein
VEELLDRHLVSEPAPGRFALHPVVRDHAHLALLATESPDELAAATNRLREADRRDAGERGPGGRGELELVSPRDPRVA